MLLGGVRHLPVLDELGRIVDVKFRLEELKTGKFPVVKGKAPLRISFAGGGTDISYFFEKYGGVVINATIDKYCRATAVKRADHKIIINSDIDGEFEINSKKDIEYNGKFDLIKALIKLMDPNFGFEIYIHSDLPPGRGLGSSATFAVLIASILNHFMEKKYDDYKIAEIAYKAEHQELGIKGGWQDQYAAVTGGFNFMEFTKDKTIIYPLKLREKVINELNHHLLLCYVGKSHFSGDLHEKQEENFREKEKELLENLKNLKVKAIEIKDSLLTNNIKKIGHTLNESWENKRKLSANISNPKIDELYGVGLKNGAYGGKLLGAGGGGYILFFYFPKKRNQLVKALENSGGEIMNFNFDFNGTQVWSFK